MLQPIILFAFVLGAALSLASTCTIAATKRMVLHRKADWMLGIIFAVCWSGMTVLVLRAFVPGQLMPPTSIALSWTLVGASVAMGVGAFVNRACFIGSVGHIGTGNVSYLMTFAGLAVARLIPDIPSYSMPKLSEAPALDPLLFWTITAVFLAGFLYSGFRALWRRQRAIIALCVMGVFSVLTFASNPNWTYENWVGQVVNGHGFSPTYEVEITVLALFSGAVVAAMIFGKFALRGPKTKVMLRCFLGGALMGFGARFVPGGNDTLLLWVIPNYALYGMVAYAIMVLTAALLVWSTHRFRRATQGG